MFRLAASGFRVIKLVPLIPWFCNDAVTILCGYCNDTYMHACTRLMFDSELGVAARQRLFVFPENRESGFWRMVCLKDSAAVCATPIQHILGNVT